MKKRFQLSTFFRYTLSYITLLAVILTGIFGYMYFYVNNEVRSRTVDSHVNRLNRIAMLHEDHLSSMMNTAVQMGLSPSIEPFQYSREPQKAYDLLRQIAPYTVTNSFCDKMYLCFAEDDHIYASSASMTLDMFLNMVHYENVTSDQLLHLIRSPGPLTVLPAQMMESSMMDGDRASVVTFLMPLGTSINNSTGTVIFILKESVYWSMFSDAIESNNNTYIFHHGQLLASAQDYDVPLEDVYAQLRNAQQDNLNLTFSSGGESYKLLSVSRRAWGMQYVTVLRTSDLTSSMGDSIPGLLIVLLTLTAGGVLVALLLARRNVKPIREISNLLPHSPDGDELASIQTGIRELSARNSDLTFRLERSLPLQRHDFILRFMKGRYLSREEACRAASAVGMNIDMPCYAVILSGVQDYHEQPLDLRRAPFDSLPSITGCGVELVALKAHMYVVFSETPEAIRQMAEMLRQAVLERSGHAMVALSGIHTNFAHAPNAYLEAASAYDNRFLMDENALLDYSSISTSIEEIMPLARKITEGINHALLLKDRALLSDKIAELLHFLKHTSMSPYAFRLIYNDVIGKLLREHTGALAETELYDIFSLSNCQSADDLDAMLRKLCTSLLTSEEVSPCPNPTEEEGSIAQVVQYMRDHYTDPELSISAIAEAFDMPTARLSLAFKELVRMSPLEYLTLLRVERSKELLSETEKSIKEIASKVGYYDASSFIRRFKQIVGVTPLQYRRSKEDNSHGTHPEG